MLSPPSDTGFNYRGLFLRLCEYKNEEILKFSGRLGGGLGVASFGRIMVSFIPVSNRVAPVTYMVIPVAR